MTTISRRNMLKAAGTTIGIAALAGCGKPDTSPNRSVTDDPPEDYSRYVDCEAGVVIYEQNMGEGGFEVVDIDDTDLIRGEVCK